MTGIISEEYFCTNCILIFNTIHILSSFDKTTVWLEEVISVYTQEVFFTYTTIRAQHRYFTTLSWRGKKNTFILFPVLCQNTTYVRRHRFYMKLSVRGICEEHFCNLTFIKYGHILKHGLNERSCNKENYYL